MSRSYGEVNPELTKAINSLARRDSTRVKFTRHSRQEMENDGFDHMDVLTCLRKGKAHGPEYQGGELRTNVTHRGMKIRVVVGSIEHAADGWSSLEAITVVTVMEEG